MEKSIHFTSFPKEIFSVYFEHNRNSMENIKSFSSLEHGLKSDKSASSFLKLCLHLC